MQSRGTEGNELRDAITKCLQKAVNDGHKSVAVPAIAVGGEDLCLFGFDL